MAPITKLSYLKEFVVPKVRQAVDGLPINAEGYNKAKSILGNRYGKESEIVKAYMRGVIDLPTVRGSDPIQVLKLYERFKGNVQLTLDKLSGIRNDLVSRDDE